MLVGCGGSTENSDNKKDTQVVANVNGEEVTVHQLNQALSQVRVKITAENQKEIEQQAIQFLVEQTLVLQAAKEAKIDRTPETLSVLEEAKRKVLVDAYVQRTLRGIGKPTPQDVATFYNERPQIFADRKIFVYSLLTIPAEKEAIEPLVNQLKDISNLNELLPVLKDKGIDYNKVIEAKPFEQLAPALQAPLNTLKTGGIGYVKMTDGILVLELQQALPQPITLEQATPEIERQLYNQKQQEAAVKLVESLKESAQVKYMGDFAPK